ncbi:hypothetical protein Taro_047720 [Colocasia esculenta]|uniref:Cystatin domain-containing protein n=1 Tax=Colocasia esculenta TaxID=4460 RepID=A0A843X6X1_COLES|nr:hypothetical protein [Colocasia esculenta]
MARLDHRRPIPELFRQSRCSLPETPWRGGSASISEPSTEDIDDPCVPEIGKFTVAEHNNKQAGEELVFIRVVSGQHQVVAGTNYKLFLEAKDAGARHTYTRPWFSTSRRRVPPGRSSPSSSLRPDRHEICFMWLNTWR